MTKEQNCSFNHLQKEFKLIRLVSLCSEETKVEGTLLTVIFLLVMEATNIYEARKKHKDAEQTLVSVKNISSFMLRCEGDKIAASEDLVAYHTVPSLPVLQMTWLLLYINL